MHFTLPIRYKCSRLFHGHYQWRIFNILVEQESWKMKRNLMALFKYLKNIIDSNLSLKLLFYILFGAFEGVQIHTLKTLYW